MKAGGVPVKSQSRKRLCWSLAVTSTIKNEKHRFHLAPGVNEHIIANALSKKHR